MNTLLLWAPLLGPALAALVAIIGFGISHALTSKRDLNAEKRKVRVTFMIEAYRKLENGSCRGKNAATYSDAFHSALADIQLLGSPGQVEAARKVALALGSGSGEPVSINELLNALRQELRRELNLPEVDGQLVIVRSPEELDKRNELTYDEKSSDLVNDCNGAKERAVTKPAFHDAGARAP